MNQIKEIYQQFYTYVSGTIANREHGKLYYLINFLVENTLTPQPNSAGVTKEICGYFKITPEASQEDDNAIVKNLQDLILDEQFNIREINPFLSPQENKMDEINWLIFTACTIIGLFFCIRSLKPRLVTPLANPPQIPRPKIPAVLCLVLPANRVYELNLNIDSMIDKDTVTKLINNAVYFRCASYGQVRLFESKLELKTDIITDDPHIDVYIQIDTNDGESILNQTTRFALKSNLSSNAQYKITRLNCLKSMNGLETFKHI